MRLYFCLDRLEILDDLDALDNLDVLDNLDDPEILGYSSQR